MFVEGVTRIHGSITFSRSGIVTSQVPVILCSITLAAKKCIWPVQTPRENTKIIAWSSLLPLFAGNMRFRIDVAIEAVESMGTLQTRAVPFETLLGNHTCV